MTEPNRQSGENEERIIEIEIERLRPFKEHPFQVKDANENGVKLSHQAPTLYDVVPKEEIAEFEELMRKTIADIVSEASSIACWVYVQKYVKQKTLDEMLQELPGAGQFIIVMDTWFERLMAE